LKVQVIIVIAITGLMGAVVQAAEGPTKDVPQLKVLDYYAGEWKSEFSLSPAGDTTTAQHFKGKVVSKWILNGKFLQQTGTYEAGDNQPPVMYTTLYTYDAKHQTYRYWTFDSSGGSSQSEGTWDQTTKVMTWQGQDEQTKLKSILESNHSKSDVNPWSITIKTEQGQPVIEINGNNTRIKK